MAESKTREWRLKAAELAKAYMAGGDPPYQAARKTGFMRVAIMEDAIRELENARGNGTQAPAQESAQQEQSMMLDYAKWGTKVELIPGKDYYGGIFHIREFAANGKYQEMIRIWAGDRTQYIYAKKEEASELLDLLRQVVQARKERRERTRGTRPSVS